MLGIRNRKFLYATSALMSTMVGVGIFGLPFAFSKSGFFVGLGFLVLITLITLLIDWMYGEIVLRTEAKHQLVGYTRLYLGPTFQKLIFFAAVFTGYSALLAYTIIAGDFLNTIFSSFFYASLQTYSLLFLSIVSLLVLRGLKTVSWIDFFVAILLFIVVILVILSGITDIQPSNLTEWNYEFWFLPYGVLLFAFSGLLGVPIQREILQGQEHRLKKSIFWAVLLVAILYALFSFIVVGISGDTTTPDVVGGLYEYIGSNIVFLVSIFGILAISTCFLMLASGMLEIFNFDFDIPRVKAWALVVFPPAFLYLAGIRTFVNVISLAGAVAIALEGIILVFIYAKAKHKGHRVPEYSLHIPKWILYALIFVFIAGMAYAFIS